MAESESPFLTVCVIEVGLDLALGFVFGLVTTATVSTELVRDEEDDEELEGFDLLGLEELLLPVGNGLTSAGGKSFEATVGKSSDEA